MEKEKKIPVGYKLYPSFIQRIRVQAAKEKRTVTNMIEYAVEVYLQKHSSSSAGAQLGAKGRSKYTDRPEGRGA